MQQFQKDHPIEVIVAVHVVELKNYIETFVAHMDDCNKCTLSFNLQFGSESPDGKTGITGVWQRRYFALTIACLILTQSIHGFQVPFSLLNVHSLPKTTSPRRARVIKTLTRRGSRMKPTVDLDLTVEASMRSRSAP